VYLGTGRLEPRWMALLLVAVALLRLLVTRQLFWLVAVGGALCLAAFSFWGNAMLPLRLYPALVAGVFWVVFATSLRYPPTVVERLARLTEPGLPPEGVAYTRKVTWVWTGFLAFNTCAALATALWATPEVWALYNGLLSYLLMGLLFGGEWLVRQRVRKGGVHG